MKQKWLYILPLTLFAALAVIAALPMLQGKNPTYVPDTLVGDTVPDFAIDGLSSADIKGPALVNIFASWCIPCKAEHKLLTAAQQHFDLTIYGIVYKDSKEARDHFLKMGGNPYIKIGDDPHGLAAIAFGISGVPTTFVIDAQGHIVRRFDGPLTPADIEEIILPVMKGETE